MREPLTTHKDVLLKLEQLEKKSGNTTNRLKRIFDYLKEFFNQNKEAKPIGFKYGRNL